MDGQRAMPPGAASADGDRNEAPPVPPAYPDRTTPTRTPPPVIGGDGWSLDPIARTLNRGGEVVVWLEPLRFRLLALLFMHPGEWVSQSNIAKRLGLVERQQPSRWLNAHFWQILNAAGETLPIEREKTRMRVRWADAATVTRAPALVPLRAIGVELDLFMLEVVAGPEGERHRLPPQVFQLLARIALDGAVEAARGRRRTNRIRVANFRLRSIGVAGAVVAEGARIVLTKRPRPMAAIPPTLEVTCGDVTLDLFRRTLMRRGVLVAVCLRRYEVAVLAMLLRHPGQRFTRDELYREVDGSTSGLTTALTRLRARVAPTIGLLPAPGRYGIAPSPGQTCTVPVTPRFRPFEHLELELDLDLARVRALGARPVPWSNLRLPQLRFLVLLGEAPVGGKVSLTQLRVAWSPGTSARRIEEELTALDRLLRTAVRLGVQFDDADAWLVARSADDSTEGKRA